MLFLEAAEGASLLMELKIYLLWASVCVLIRQGFIKIDKVKFIGACSEHIITSYKGDQYITLTTDT